MSDVTAKVKRIAKEKYGIEVEGELDEEGDDSIDPLVRGAPGAKSKGKSAIASGGGSNMNVIVQTIERIEDRIIRIERKVDDMFDVVQEVKRDGKRAAPSEEIPPYLNENDGLPIFESPPKKIKMKPKILGIPYIEVKTAYEGKKSLNKTLFISNKKEPLNNCGET